MFHLIEPQLGRISGGLRYNHAVVEAAAGQIQRHEIPGAWPHPIRADVQALNDLICRLDGPVLLDGLIGCSLEPPVCAHVPIVQLVHALAESPTARDRERNCLKAADAVVATSRFAAEALKHRHGIEVTVAAPGVEPRPVATGSKGRHFISVGGIEPNKNQRFLAHVLGQLDSLGLTDWHCTFAGPATDTAYAAELRRDLAQLPGSRTTLAGELDADALAALYDTADLLVFPSRAETFGLVVREATAAGIPALVTAGTGAEEALGGGTALELEEAAWVDALRRWLTEPSLRETFQTDAQVARQRLSYGWQATANTILNVLASVGSG